MKGLIGLLLCAALGSQAQHRLSGREFMSPTTQALQDDDAQNPAFAADLRTWVDRTVQLFSDRILPFTVEDARIWGRLSQEIGHGGADLMIAATALARGATVVTGNVDDFRATGVALENPF